MLKKSIFRGLLHDAELEPYALGACTPQRAARNACRATYNTYRYFSYH